MKLSGQLHDSAALLPGKELPVCTEDENVWASEPVWKLWRKAKLSNPAGESNPDSQDTQPVAYS
jgi:hypothetical protein